MSFEENIEPFRYLLSEEMEGGSADALIIESDLFSGDMPEEVLVELLEAEPEYISGYLWEGLIKTMIANEFEEEAEAIQYDSEAGAATLYAEDRQLLQAIAERFHEICDSETEFRELVESAEELDY